MHSGAPRNGRREGPFSWLSICNFMLESFRHRHPMRMPRLLLSLALGALLSLQVPLAMALGFVRSSNATVLGQPLEFAVGVRLDGNESLVAECVSVQVFSGDNLVPSTAVRVSIEPGVDPLERTLRVGTTALIDEPVVSVILQITCPTRVARKFVEFIDPPLISLASAAQPMVPAGTPAASTPSARGAPGTDTLVAAVASTPSPVKAKPRPQHTRPAVTAGVSGASPATPASGTSERSPRPGASAAKSSRAPVAASGARLKLEAADDEATRERLNLRLTAALAPVPQAAASGASQATAALDADAAQRASARERMQALEESLTRLRAESAATQASLAQLQLRLHEAEAQRYSNPLVFALVALAAALAAVVALLLWKLGGNQRALSQWWDPAANAPKAEVDAEHEDDANFEWARPGQARPNRPGPKTQAAPLVETTASPMMLTQVHAAAEAAAESAARAAASEHEMSVEELIDLEQQAEFFVVLGQDEAAIDLLMGHLRSSGGDSPLPYLKLLEIYRRRGDHEAYERVRDRFNRRFNAYAQDWESDLQQGRTLLDYPTVISRLQSLWTTPTQAMQAIEASLFRRDATSPTFDLPAYRELLFLFSVARDLTERETPPDSVDLLLPLGGESADSPLTRLHPTPAATASVHPPTTVDVDISRLDADPSVDEGSQSRFQTDFGATSGYGDSGAKLH